MAFDRAFVDLLEGHEICPHLFLPVILPQVQPVKDVSMPRLQIDCKSPLSFSTSLIHISAVFKESEGDMQDGSTLS